MDRAAELVAAIGLTIVRRIGVGGMGEVYLAKRVGAAGFEKLVVVKRLSQHVSANEELAEALVREATIMVRLNHPNIVQVQDLVERSGEYLMVLEYVDGVSLRRVLKHASNLAEPPPLAFTLSVMDGVLHALDYAHQHASSDGKAAPVIHCDVTPENLLISRGGRIKLADFGIARALSGTSVTSDGQIRGKLRYVSPEQASGGKLGPPTDVYSVGLVLYELITLEAARKAQDTVGLVSEALRSGPVELPEGAARGTPPETGAAGIDALIRDATQPEPDDRPTAAEMLRRVAEIANDAEVSLAPQIAVAPYLEGVLAALEPAEPVRRTLPTESPPTVAAGPEPLVLVVDDSDVVRDLLADVLPEHGFRVQTASSGGQALDWLSQHPCDAVLVDVNMPGVGGYDLCDYVRKSERLSRVPVVLLTADEDPAAAVEGLGVGADDFVRKSAPHPELAARLHAVIRRSRR
jgi:serine/threonine-protein kinase